MTAERRARQRFPMDLALRFTASKGRRKEIQGHGNVVNISSNGVAFRTDTELAAGSPIEASMEWPVALNGDCVLRVTIEGRLIRVDDGLAVMTVSRHEFRTCGRVGAPSPGDLEVLKRRLGNILTPRSRTPQCTA